MPLYTSYPSIHPFNLPHPNIRVKIDTVSYAMRGEKRVVLKEKAMCKQDKGPFRAGK
jgi:hypothetical protein